jgi:hypothetical protein
VKLTDHPGYAATSGGLETPEGFTVPWLLIHYGCRFMGEAASTPKIFAFELSKIFGVVRLSADGLRIVTASHDLKISDQVAREANNIMHENEWAEFMCEAPNIIKSRPDNCRVRFG